MADRRCFHRRIVESDQFYKLSASAQSLYFHLNMAADDDGFVIGAESVTSRSRTGKADLKTLVERRFILRFGDVYVVSGWRVSNSLKNDRSKPLTYPEIAAHIWVKANREYTDQPAEGIKTLYEAKTGMAPPVEFNRNPNGIQPESEWNPNGIPTEPNRTEPNRTEPNRTEQNRSGEGWFEVLWTSYPEAKRGSKAAAEEAVRGIVSEADRAKAMESLEAWKLSEQWNKADGQYIPMLVNWLTKGQWETIPQPANGMKPRALDADEMAAIRQMMAGGDGA